MHALDRLLDAGAAPRPRLRQPAVAGGPWAPGRSPAGAGCTPTPRRRCARPATARRGPRPTRPTRTAVHAAVDAAFDDPRVADVVEDLLDRPGGPGLEQRPRGQAGGAHHARRPGRLPGQRAVGAEPGRPRQPAVRSTSTPGPAARRAGPGAAVPSTADRTTPAPRSSLVTRAALTPAPRPARSCSPPTRRSRRPGRPPTTCSPSTAAARSPWPPGSRSGWPSAAAGAGTPLELPAGTGATSISGAASRARRTTACWPSDASRDTPGRPAGRGTPA